MPDPTHHITGYVVAAQEERFRLMSDSGQTLLFTLANHAPIGPSDLTEWHKAHTHVWVEYTGQPNLVSGIARAVQPV